MNFPDELIGSRVLKTKDAATLLGVSLSHFRRLYWRGQLPAPVRLGERLLGWRVGDLNGWTESRLMRDVPHIAVKETRHAND